DGQPGARQPYRGGAHRSPGALANRSPPRAARCRRDRRGCDGGGQSARAHRGPLPDVARCAPDSRGAGAGRYRGRCGCPSEVGGKMNVRAYVAELLGTFMFFAIGMSSVQAVAAMQADAPKLVVVAFAFGFGLLAAIFTFGHISGGH